MLTSNINVLDPRRMTPVWQRVARPSDARSRYNSVLSQTSASWGTSPLTYTCGIISRLEIVDNVGLHDQATPCHASGRLCTPLLIRLPAAPAAAGGKESEQMWALQDACVVRVPRPLSLPNPERLTPRRGVAAVPQAFGAYIQHLAEWPGSMSVQLFYARRVR